LLYKLWNRVHEVYLVAASSEPRCIGSRTPANIQHHSGWLDEPSVDYFFRPKEFKLEDPDLEPVTLGCLPVVIQNLG